MGREKGAELEGTIIYNANQIFLLKTFKLGATTWKDFTNEASASLRGWRFVIRIFTKDTCRWRTSTQDTRRIGVGCVVLTVRKNLQQKQNNKKIETLFKNLLEISFTKVWKLFSWFYAPLDSHKRIKNVHFADYDCKSNEKYVKRVSGSPRKNG